MTSLIVLDPNNTAVCASRVFAFVDDITKWMASNRLMVNPINTDVLWCSTSQPPPDTSLSPAGTTVQPSASVRNLIVLFDANLSLSRFTSTSLLLAATVLCAISRVVDVHSVVMRQLLWLTVSLSRGWTIATAFSLAATSNLLTNFNCAARVIFGGDRREHVTPLLHDKLHWLRARERITFKLLSRGLFSTPPALAQCWPQQHSGGPSPRLHYFLILRAGRVRSLMIKSSCGVVRVWYRQQTRELYKS